MKKLTHIRIFAATILIVVGLLYSSVIAVAQPVGLEPPLDSGTNLSGALGTIGAVAPGGIPVQDRQATIWQKITKQIDKVNQAIGYNILTSTLQVTLNRIALDTAKYIAEGNVGGTPFIRTKSFEGVWTDARDTAYGEFIGRLSDGYFEGLGLDLCEPSADVQARISLGIINDITPPSVKPRCEIRQVQKNWEQFGQTLNSGRWLTASLSDLSPDDKVNFFAEYLDPKNNDIGAFLKLNDLARQQAADKQELAKLNEATCRGYIDAKRPLSNDISHTCEQILNLHENAINDYIAEASLLKSENVFKQSAVLFTKTLTSRLMKRFISGSWSLADLNSNSGSTNLRDSLIAKLRSRVDLRRLGSASELLADLNTVDVQAIDNFDYVSEMGACPADTRIASQLNCTTDTGLVTAINNRETVREALDRGHLHANWPLVSYLNSSINGGKKCYQNSYCYSNISKMRSYRILPLGWEIAAALSPVGRPVTLGQVINCFENNGNCDLDAAANIYYHLIDPDWVLAAPLTQCKALVSGPSLEDVNSNQRQQVCVDRPSCLSEDDKGNCQSGYGYCTKERNVWRFAGTQCQEQYASCQVLVRRDNGAKYSYLTNTLATCDASQAGCTWYSKSQTNFGTATDPNYDWNPADRIYFNNNAASCPAEADGCQEYINPTSATANLVANSDFADYQANPSTDYSNPDWINDDKADTFVGWTGNGLQTFTSNEAAQFGPVGIRISGDGSLSTSALSGQVAGKAMTLSWFAKATTACQTQATISSATAPGSTVDVSYTDSWQRYQLTYTFGVDVPDTQVLAVLQSKVSCGSLFIDGVKVEFGTRATAYTTYGQSGTVYLSGQRSQCTAQEVGCSLYSPTNGDAVIPGVISQNDYCPTECVGYQTYAQLPTNFELAEGASATAKQINFIAKTAKACPATEVGCSEFTNLDEVAAGGEGKKYFSFLRQCVKADQGVTYYTLEGSDTSGFQVKTWQILPSNLATDQGPCTTIANGGSTCTDTAASQASCTAADMATNPNCREFFDTAGQSYFRLQDKVIFASNDCHPYRRSDGNQTYNGLASESRSCSASNVRCTEFRGNQSSNVRTIINDTFEGRATYAPWAGQGSGKIALSSEAASSGGHSLAVTAPGVVVYPLSNQLVAGREYYLSFWLKTSQNGAELRAYLGDTNGTQTKCGQGPCQFAVTTVATAGDWQLYKVGPLLIDQVVNPEAANLTLVPSASGTFIDNIILRESVSNLFLVRDSWKTPASCDLPFAGANLGCQLYKGTDNKNYALRSFSQICRQEAVGCQAVINTQNSNYPYEQVFNAGDKSQVTVPADSLEYVVVDSKKFCEPKYQGCQALGKPNINRNLPEQDPRYVRSYQTVFKINDPDQYSDQLCKNEGLYCQEYTGSDGVSHYYSDPGNRTCTYKDGVSINGVIQTGWFQTDSLEAGKSPVGCYSDNVTPLDDYKIYTAAENQFNNSAGLCPGSQNQCSEFIDTQATNGDNFLSNPTFNDPTGPKAKWGVWQSSGNALPLDQTFVANPQTASATLLSQPHGLALIFQRFFNTTKDVLGAKPINNADVYTISADVTVKNLNVGTQGKASAQVVMRCLWDSPYDKDYCATVVESGNSQYGTIVDYANTCITDSDCPGKEICYKKADGYCESATDMTQTPCSSNTQCASGYTCNLAIGYDTTDSRGNRRDHLTEFYAGADIQDKSTVQTLTATADLGSASQGDELVMCEPTFRLSLDCPSGGDCDNNSTPNEVQFSNLSLRKAQSYFYLNNKSIDDSSCNGQVSKNEGCILFSDPNDPVKQYNSFLTYFYSERANGKGVSPVVCDPSSADPILRACTNDANRIIKVSRDRQCAEWLTCKTSSQIFDTQTNSQRQICTEVALCDQYSSNNGSLNCAHWLPESTSKVDYSAYTTRDVRYDALDYSGYSLFNRYPVDHLRLVDVSINAAKNGPDAANPDFRLVRAENCTTAECNQLATNYGQLKCGTLDGKGQSTGAIFGVSGSPLCVNGIDGSRFDLTSPFVIKPTTRGFAETEAPFPQSVVSSNTGQQRRVKFGFQQANICDSAVASCEVGYYKLQYGSGGATRFYSLNASLGSGEISSCICQGGNLDGRSCTVIESNSDTKSSISDQCPGGNPTYLSRSDIFLNWGGYCLEPDLSSSINGSSSEYACLSWLPVDNAIGGIDYFNQNRDAGYNFKAPVYYCTEMQLVEDRYHWRTAPMKLKDVGDYYSKMNRDGSLSSSNATNGGMGGEWTHEEHIILPWKDNTGDAHDVYPIAAYRDPVTNKITSNCIDNPTILGWVRDDNVWIGYSEHCLGRYNGSTDYLSCTNSNSTCDGSRGDFIQAESWPRSLCTYLTAAVNERGDNAAKTNSFWANYRPDGKPFVVSLKTAGQGYTLDRDDTPFGAAVPGSGFVPQQFGALSVQDRGVVPRAGSPYACANDEADCRLLSDSKSDLYIKGWTHPSFGDSPSASIETKEWYVTGVNRLKQIYQKLFGIYRFEAGESCAYPVCSGGPFGGNRCGATGSINGECTLRYDRNNPTDQSKSNVCQTISNTCINSAWGTATSCSSCPAGWQVDLTTGGCYQLISPSEISCAVCTTGQGQCAKRCTSSDQALCISDSDCPANATCGQTSCERPQVDARSQCQVRESLTCNMQAQRCCSSRDASKCTVISCTHSFDDCDALAEAYDSKTFCAPAQGQYCVGVDFSDTSTTGVNQLTRVQSCATAITNNLGQRLNAGNEICQAPDAICKYANQVEVSINGGNDKRPYCTPIRDSYQPLCNPDTDPTCIAGSTQAIDEKALPLDASMSQSFAVRNANGTTIPQSQKDQIAAASRSSRYAQADFGPIIAQPVCSASSITCDLGPTSNFLVNDKSSGPIIENQSPTMLATVSFYASAYKDRMPLRSIEVDWGDGSRQANVGYYKNNWSVCDPTQIIRPNVSNPAFQTTMDFAGTSQGCDPTIRSYFHVYQYNVAFDGASSGISGCPAGYACYRPRARVQDNWGWCSNTAWGPVGQGCTGPAGNQAGYIFYGSSNDSMIQIKKPQS